MAQKASGAGVLRNEAQHALSIDYGFKSWSGLTKHANASRQERSHRELRKLLNVLQTSDDQDRQSSAIHSIGLLGIQEGLPYIIPFIESPFKHLQWEAVRTVIRLMGDKCRPLVYHMLGSAAPNGVKELIATHFGQTEKDEKSINYLTTRFQTSETIAMGPRRWIQPVGMVPPRSSSSETSPDQACHSLS